MFYYESFAKHKGNTYGDVKLDNVRMYLLKNVIKELLILTHGWGEIPTKDIKLDDLKNEVKPYSIQLNDAMFYAKTKSNKDTPSGIVKYRAIQNEILSKTVLNFAGDSLIAALRYIDGESHFFNIDDSRMDDLRKLNNSLYSFIGCSSIVVDHHISGELLSNIIIRSSSIKFLVKSMSTSWKHIYNDLYKTIMMIAIKIKRCTSVYIDTRNFLCTHYSPDKILSRYQYILESLLCYYPDITACDESGHDVKLLHSETLLIRECFGNSYDKYMNTTAKRKKYGGTIDTKKVLSRYRKVRSK